MNGIISERVKTKGKVIFLFGLLYLSEKGTIIDMAVRINAKKAARVASSQLQLPSGEKEIF